MSADAEGFQTASYCVWALVMAGMWVSAQVVRTLIGSIRDAPIGVSV